MSSPTVQPSRPRPSSPGASSNRVLLAYFSRAGENYRYGGRVDLKVGNTQVVAEMIAARAAVDVYRIEAADPYPHDYEETVARNVQEEQDDARPKIAGSLPSLGGYDTILLGSPVWNVQEPMIMRTFIEALDWTGKTVHPFVTYAVSGIGHVQDDYTRVLPGVTVSDGLAVQGETVRDSLPQIQAWLRRINLV
jgi:flavodoxin